MTTLTARTSRSADASRSARPSRPSRSARATPWIPTIVLLVGAIYTLIPILWVVMASTKSKGELFSTFSFLPGTGFWENLVDLSTYSGGVYWRWAFNSLVYAGGGAVLSTLVSAAAGYALARFRFRGRALVFNVMLAGVMVPGITLAIPQYFLMAELGLANTYWAVLLPSIINPFGIYLATIYAQSSVPEETVEAARIDGAGEFRIFRSIAIPVMIPGLITVFMLQFVGIWNNFLLPFIMLSNEELYPLTTGLYLMLNRGSGTPALYSLAIIGALLAIIPLLLLMLFLQRFWRLDLISGSLKG